MTHPINQTPKPQRPRRSLSERILPLFTDTAVALTALILALVFALVLLGSLLNRAAAEEAPTRMYVTGVKSWLNGRAEPRTDSDVEARFTLGTDVDVYEVSGQWARVAGGESGFVWCSMAYLTDSPQTAEPETFTVRSNGRVRVRETPDGDLVRWLEDGDTVQVTSRIDGWAYIGDGYVRESWPGGGLEAVE